MFSCLRCGRNLADKFAFCGSCGAYIAGIPLPVEETPYFSDEGELSVKQVNLRDTKSVPLLARGARARLGYAVVGRKVRRPHVRKPKAKGRLVLTNTALYCHGNKYAFDKILSVTREGWRKKSITLRFENAMDVDETAANYSVEMTLKTENFDSLLSALEQLKLLQQTIDKNKQDVSMRKDYKPMLSPSDYVKKGEACAALGDFEGAIENYSQAIELDSENHWLYYMRGSIYQKIGEMEKTADDFRFFQLNDDRQTPQLGTTPWGFLHGVTNIIHKASEQAKLQIVLCTGTLKKILRTLNPFDVDYSNKQLYEWQYAMIADTRDEVLKLEKEEPQEAAYRLGVELFLRGKYKEAIQRLDEAIMMNPEDAKFYLFRGIVHALQSRKGGRFGLSRSAEMLSRSAAKNDFDQALTLSKNNTLIKHAYMRAMVCALQECPRCGKTSIEYYHVCS